MGDHRARGGHLGLVWNSSNYITLQSVTVKVFIFTSLNFRVLPKSRFSRILIFANWEPLTIFWWKQLIQTIKHRTVKPASANKHSNTCHSQRSHLEANPLSNHRPYKLLVILHNHSHAHRLTYSQTPWSNPLNNVFTQYSELGPMPVLLLKTVIGASYMSWRCVFNISTLENCPARSCNNTRLLL